MPREDLGQLARRDALQHVADRAGPQRAGDVAGRSPRRSASRSGSPARRRGCGRAASMPPPGIEMSSSARSGACASTSATASSALPAAPTHGEGAALLEGAHQPVAEDRMVVGEHGSDRHRVSPLPSGSVRVSVVPRAGLRIDPELAADAFGAIAQAGEALAAVARRRAGGARDRSPGRRRPPSRSAGRLRPRPGRGRRRRARGARRWTAPPAGSGRGKSA